jgi:RHS repeat-associated protein
MSERLFTDKLVCGILAVPITWSLDSATPSPSAYPAHASGSPGTSERRGSATTFLHSGVKNAELQTNSSAITTASKAYDAFGNAVSSMGSWQGPFGYAGAAGYQEDASGLKLLGHRYYDSSAGRFLTRDPMNHGRNWYVYCVGNPTIAMDPTGFIMATLGGQAMVMIGPVGVSGSIGLSIDLENWNVGVTGSGRVHGGIGLVVDAGSVTLDGSTDSVPNPGDGSAENESGISVSGKLLGGGSAEYNQSRDISPSGVNPKPKPELGGGGDFGGGAGGQGSVFTGIELKIGLFNLADLLDDTFGWIPDLPGVLEDIWERMRHVFPTRTEQLL